MIKKKLLSLILAICMAMSLAPTIAFAGGGTSPVQIEVKNAQNGNTQYKVGDGEWTDLNSSQIWDVSNVSDGDTVTVRAMPNSEQELDTTGTEFRVNGYQEIIDRNALQTEAGWHFTYTEGSVYQVCVEYRSGGAGDPNPGNSGELRFICQSQMIIGGSIYYKLNGAGEFTRVSEEDNRYHAIPLSDTDETLTIKLAPHAGFQLDMQRGVAMWVDGNRTNLHSADFTKEAGCTINLSELVGDGSVSQSRFELEFGFENEGGAPGPGPEPGDEPVHGGYEGVEKTVSVTVIGKADFYINDSRMVHGNDGDIFDDVRYHYDGNGFVDFYFNCFVGERITTLKINGADYYNDLPDPGKEGGKEALLDACKGQLNEFKITVPYSESGYEIESSVKWLDDDDKDYMVVGNFLWTYEDQNQGDDYIDHGRMELLGVSYRGTDYSPDDLNNPGTAFDWGQEENGGSAVLPVGAVVTVKLVPDYGYQLTSFGINGGDFGTGGGQSVFTFEIKPGNAHLGAHFTPVADKVTSSSRTVTSGSIELGSGLSGGSAQLEISDAKNELSDEKLEAFEAAAGNYAITDYLNLELYNVYYKGSTDADAVWKNEVNTLDSDATISVSLADFPLAGTVDPSNIVIIHNIHNGEDFETIPIDSYDSETNTITFKTDSFSTYAIATTYSVHVNTVDNSVDTSSISVELFVTIRNGETGEAASPVRIGTVTPDNITVGIFETVRTNAIEEAKTMLNAWLETSRRENPGVQYTVVGDMAVMGDKVSFDNRTYTMRNSEPGSGTASRYMEINGDYGYTGSYSVTLTVEVQDVRGIPSYSITEGANEVWTENTDGTLTVRADGDFSKFVGVKVNDTLIDAKNYTAVPGSTVITLKTDYLKTLSVGTYKLTVVYNDGECSTNFEVKKAASEQPKPTEPTEATEPDDTQKPTNPTDTSKPADSQAPKAGDSSHPALWFALLFVSGVGILGAAVYRKRRNRISD